MRGMKPLLGDNTACGLFYLPLSVLSFSAPASLGADRYFADISLSYTQVSLSLTCSSLIFSCPGLFLIYVFFSSTRIKFSFSLPCFLVSVCESVCLCAFVYARTGKSLHLCLWVFLWCHRLMHSVTYWGNKKLLCGDSCGPLIKHLQCDLIAGSCHRISYIFWALRQNASPISGAEEGGKRERNGSCKVIKTQSTNTQSNLPSRDGAIILHEQFHFTSWK